MAFVSAISHDKLDCLSLKIGLTVTTLVVGDVLLTVNTTGR